MNTIELSQDLLDRLASEATRSDAIAEVCSLLNCRWNRGVNWLDHNYPGWRGYPNPTVVTSQLLEVA